LVEEIDGRRIVHADVGVRSELLVLLHSHFPDHVSMDAIFKSLDRQKPASIRNRIGELYDAKLIQGDVNVGHRLTSAGFDTATAIIAKLLAQQAA